LIILKQESPVSIYYGTIDSDTDTLSSDYICSSLNEPKLRKGGLLLSFYALLLANKSNPNITTFSGGISGGIPSLTYEDTPDEVITKRKALSDYHIKNGAVVNENIFTYNLDNVMTYINEHFRTGGKRQKRKSKRTKSKRKKSKRISSR
jgi:hypothetical protein